MKKQMRNKWITVGLSALILFTVTVIVVIAAEPGSETDPLITKSYIDSKVIPEIKNYIDQEIGKLKDLIGAGSASPETSNKFVVVNISKGQRFVAGAGTEFILRMGNGTVFSSPKGGIVDGTAGSDITDGNVPPNHMLICPLGDERGFIADSDVIIMVKGSYAIQ